MSQYLLIWFIKYLQTILFNDGQNIIITLYSHSQLTGRTRKWVIIMSHNRWRSVLEKKTIWNALIHTRRFLQLSQGSHRKTMSHIPFKVLWRHFRACVHGDSTLSLLGQAGNHCHDEKKSQKRLGYKRKRYTPSQWVCGRKRRTNDSFDKRLGYNGLWLVQMDQNSMTK